MTEQQPQSSADYHQRRGAAWDIIDEALLAYDGWLLDDDYDVRGILDRIIDRMRERRALYAAHGEGEHTRKECQFAYCTTPERCRADGCKHPATHT